MAVITALTAQNTLGVSGVSAVEPAFVRKQLEAIYSDLPTPYVKTGMLLNAAIINEVASFFDELVSANKNETLDLVIDPVMISSSGYHLLEDDAIEAYVERLFSLARVITPNNLETRHFTGITVASVDQAIEASFKLIALGARAVVVKGGDTVFRESTDTIFDVLNDNGKIHVYERALIGSRNSHGTGCAFASSICSGLAHGLSLPVAVDLAGKYVGGALAGAYPTGQGAGAINHLWNTCLKDLNSDSMKSD